MDHTTLQSTLVQLIEDYADVSPSFVETHEGPFTSTSFARIVATGRPAILRNAYPDVPALDWTASSLRATLGSTSVSIAATPDGLADSIVDGRYFVEPCVHRMPFTDFLDRLRRSPSSAYLYNASPADLAMQDPVNVLYLQSQNDNLSPDSLPQLASDTPPPPFAMSYFTTEPEATNLWIGDHRSTTTLHRDSSYHNLYCVIRGAKTFTLYPPIAEVAMYERPYECAQWVPNERGELRVEPSDDGGTVPWASVNPLAEGVEAGKELFAHARKVQVVARVERGDVLYLPPAWWHAVQQECGDDDGWQPCIAVNWWWDREIGIEWAVQGLLGRLSRAVHGCRENEVGGEV